MTVNENQVCGGGVKGEDSCNGDSGGPLMVVKEGATPRWFVIGVVSYGALSCGGDKVPAIYTRLSAYLPWVLDKLKEKPGGPEAVANATDELNYTKQKLSQAKKVKVISSANSPMKKRKQPPPPPPQNSGSSKPYKWFPFAYPQPAMDMYSYSPFNPGYGHPGYGHARSFLPPMYQKRNGHSYAPMFSRRSHFDDYFSPRMYFDSGMSDMQYDMDD